MTAYGIPTTYNGRAYRSRLEARWAAMFDLLGWSHEYEPYDLPGWIPDFLINGNEEILVEVKPFVELAQFDTAKIITAMKSAGKHYTEVLLLGCVLDKATDWDAARLGWLNQALSPEEAPPDSIEPWFDEAILMHRGGEWGFFNSIQSYGDRVGGLSDGGHPPTADLQEALPLWKKAGNIVQWVPR